MRLFHVLVFLTALVTSTVAFRDLNGHDIWNSLNRAYRRTYGEDSHLAARAQVNCKNDGKLRRPTKYEAQGCVPDSSRGFLSAHNCANKGGSAYLYHTDAGTMCISGASKLRASNMENGECFV
ncbi:uncharacterized protein LAESUDRAFT_728968 [Laetiporus sulphureus 93-53]|uniref:Cyanovirin-N domain-containing protein n=1 Tax=Laetiporus sulphureus 93-53 TaxID=1314785 RepID=A0A165CXK3_9APHY|nr:uncharacterized protein LAESUDRAFT_728968 [Laetiporus sulphureus 93-53]KZT03679.1 hypothetical protein LAESUDRAFT_728968 [Laetiporus sulphureus 93-53]